MRYKRVFAAVTAFCLLLCGCQKVELEKDSGSVQDVSTQEILTTQEDGEVTPVVEDTLTNMAKRAKFSMPVGVMYLYNCQALEKTESGYRCFEIDENGGIHYYEFTADFSEYTEYTPVTPASHDFYHYCGGVYAAGETALYSLTVMENHSDMEPYREGMEDYDWDAYHAAWESEYLLCTYAMDGTLVSTVQVEGLEGYRQSQGYDQFSQLYAGDGVFWLALRDGRILKITPDGALEEAYVPEIQGDDSVQYGRFVQDRDGKPVYAQTILGVNPTDGSSLYSITFSEFDPKTGSVPEPFCTVVEEGYNGFAPSVYSGGYGDYRLFVTTSQALLGIRNDGTQEEVINWEASDLSRLDVIPLEDGTFLASTNKYDETDWYRLTRMTVSETQQEEREITLGVLGEGGGINDFIREFNSSQDEYRVKIVRYRNTDGSEYGNPHGKNDALQNYKLDIISGDAPDIIVMYDSHESIMQLGKRGAFLNLYDFMEGDAEVNTDTVLPNICTAMESENGALYSLPQAFNVATIAVKSRYFDEENWTVDDMIALYADATDKQFQWTAQNDAIEMLLYGTDFVDFENGTCSFDSPEFIKILEFCSRYPESAGPPPKTDDPASWDRVNEYYGERHMRYQRDEDYLCAFELCGERGAILGSYSYVRDTELCEEMTLVGYPSNNGKGGKLTFKGELAISSTCEDKEAAWDFLKTLLMEQGDLNVYGYPVIEEPFETKLDDEMYIMYLGERTDEDFLDDDGIGYPLTQEERDDLEDYIRSCDTVLSMNEDMLNIVLEEAEMYFAGDLSAEDTAKRIQSRTEIMVSEQS